MKKMNLTKLMAVLVVLCLITSTFVGSTLAKYVTGANAEDSARVAKFGVEVGVTGAEAFGSKYENAISATGTKVVAYNAAEADPDKIVAPGTNGTLATFYVNGQPEVMTTVDAVIDLGLDGWALADSSIYFPIVIKVNGAAVTYTANTPLAEIEAAVEAAILEKINNEKTVQQTYEANHEFTVGTEVAPVTVTWEWPFYVSEANDVNDTYLGDKAAAGNAATIELSTAITVTQVD